MEDIKSREKFNKIFLAIIIPIFLVTMIFLVGCSSNSQSSTIQKLSNNMTMLQSTLNKTDTIDNSNLIVVDFMDEDNVNYSEEKISTYSPTLSDYFNKITILNNTIASTIDTNNVIKVAKINIMSKSQQVKTMCEQIKLENIKIGSNKIKTLEEINNSISSQISRIKLSKNEITNNLSNIEKIKNSYSSKTEQLTSRYKNLQASLNTRLSYYNNILNKLDNVIVVINDKYIFDNENIDYNIAPTQAENITPKDKVDDNQDKPKRNKFEKNIDTYENAGKRPNQTPYDNNYYPYNYNYTASPYGYGVNGMYPGGMYGFGMPYGFGYGLPNINTYRGIRNIDTYRKPIIKDIPTNTEENSQDKNISKDETVTPSEKRDYNIEKQSTDDKEETFVKINPRMAKRPKIERLEK